MTDTERLLRRQAAWQKSRRALSWPEKVRIAEQVRDTLEAFSAERRNRQTGTQSLPHPTFPKPAR